MNRISPIRVVLFVCILVALTVLIHSVQSRRAEQKAKATAELKQAVVAQQTATAEHANFLTKYVNTNLTKRAGSQMIAVAVVSETRSMNHAVGTALVNHFKTDRVQLTDSFFKPELVTDGLFASAFNGDTSLFNKLELAKSLDAMLLARQEVQYETNTDLNNVVTAAMHLEIVTLPVSGQIESHSWSLTANGVGIRRADARMQAEERIIKQIETDTKMSLGITTP